MQIIVLFFVGWFLITMVTNAQKGQQKKAANANQPPVPPQPAQKEKQKPVQAKAAQQQPKKAKQPKAHSSAALGEGESFRDADGCFGGSMHHHEDEGREFHGDHAHGSKKYAAPVPAAPAKTAPKMQSKVTPQQLRQAVIWREILDRPVSMRDE